MKLIAAILFILISAPYGDAQKYLLLDTKIASPVLQVNRLTEADKRNGYFPVERKDIGRFVSILEEIKKQLLDRGRAKQYELGCIRFSGVTYELAKGTRLDYTLTSVCDNIKFRMHLCNGQIGNEANAYFIDAWIKYIRSGCGK